MFCNIGSGRDALCFTNQLVKEFGDCKAPVFDYALRTALSFGVSVRARLDRSKGLDLKCMVKMPESFVQESKQLISPMTNRIR